MSFIEKENGMGLPVVAPPKFKQAETWPEMLKAWPKTTFCIVSNEFCERFSYYGMRTVLTLYLLNVLKFSDDTSTVFFNGFTVLCYSTPVLGSILADGYIGKFKTITFVSLIYAAGQIVLAVSSVQNYQSSVHPMLDMAGLLIIAFGTGGIKPCVSAFGGDQFEQGQERMLGLYFSMFYFSINAGSMISTFISPIFRSKSCLGQDSCYPLAFGVPAVLMIVATLAFLAGSFWYKKPPPKENIFGEVFRVIKQALVNKSFFDAKRDHWLDHYLDSHSCEHDEKCQELIRSGKRPEHSCQKRQFVDDVKSLFRVIIMFLPVPMFWALYDQQGSRWLIQAVQMDCRLWGSALLLPDQMQTLNAVLILAFIPIFQIVIYPLVGKCVKITPLRKMIVGGLLASSAFVISAMVQFRVNATLPDVPDPGQAFVSFVNTFQDPSCGIIITPVTDKNVHTSYLPANMSLIDDKVTSKSQVYRIAVGNGKFQWALSTNATSKCSLSTTFTTSVVSEKSFFVVVGMNGVYQTEADWTKPTEGTGEFSISINAAFDFYYDQNMVFCRREDYDDDPLHPCDPSQDGHFYFWQRHYNGNDDVDEIVNTTNGKVATVYSYKAVRPGNWNLYFLNQTVKDVDKKTPDRQDIFVHNTSIKFDIQGQGGVYAMILTGNSSMTATKTVHIIVPPNEVSILWQVPQIAVLTAAEILFSITGYEFAYSQAAPSMKSLVQALWLLTTAFGDAIIVVITLLKLFKNMAIELLFYAGVMLVVIGIFTLISIFYYEYNYYTSEKEEDESSVGESNDAYDADPLDEKPKL